MESDDMAIYEALRPIAKLGYAYKLVSGSTQPHPRTSPSVGYGDEPARVLLIGNGPAHGWGVVSHDLALTGQLARKLSQRTASGCRVDYVGDEVMNAAAALSWLGKTDLSVYDAVVIVIGVNDAVRLTSVASWTSSMAALLDYLDAGLPARATISLAEIQKVTSVPVYGPLLGGLGNIHARKLNAALRELASSRARCSMFVVGEPAPAHGRSLGGSAVYESWAERVAAAVPPFPTAEPMPVIARERSVLAGTWTGLERARALAASEGETALTRITDAARKKFNVPIAAISLIEDDRVFYAGHGLPISIPSELSHCVYVVDSAAPLVVPSSRRDPRFQGNPLIDLTNAEFYAGHPVYSSTGETIGTFCLMGAFSRKASSVSMEQLKEFALQAQAELWKLEGSATDESGTVTLAQS